MFLSLLKLNPASWAVRRGLADCQQLHQTIMAAFPEASEAAARQSLGVLFRLEATENGTLLYVQSRAEPDWSRLPQGYCLPGGVACKPVSEKYAAITSGMVLRFRLRANPTKRLPAGCPGEKRDGPRVDLRREEDQLKWLRRKADAAGITLLEVQVGQGVPDVVVTGEQNRVRGRHPAGKLTFGAVLFEGRLQVREAELFRRALEQGVGSGKAYGFGLISVAPSR